MPYTKNDRGFPDLYIKEDDQMWFESLDHMSKFNIHPKYVSESKLKSFGIKTINRSEAVAWMYQAFNHDIVLLYDLSQYVPPEDVTVSQKQRYNNYLNQVERFEKGEIKYVQR